MTTLSISQVFGFNLRACLCRSAKRSLRGKRVFVTRPPPPSFVLWENIGLHAVGRILLKVRAYLVLLFGSLPPFLQILAWLVSVFYLGLSVWLVVFMDTKAQARLLSCSLTHVSFSSDRF